MNHKDLIEYCITELKSSDEPLDHVISDLQRQHPELDPDDWRVIGQALLDEADELERYSRVKGTA